MQSMGSRGSFNSYLKSPNRGFCWLPLSPFSYLPFESPPALDGPLNNLFALSAFSLQSEWHLGGCARISTGCVRRW